MAAPIGLRDDFDAPRLRVWPRLRVTRISFVVCCLWRRSMTAARAAMRLGSGASGFRRFAIGCCGSTLMDLRV